jgi:glutamyl-tRNA synthetase
LRVAKRKHPRVKLKYKVWPMLEFSWAVDDNLLGITHIIRGKDLLIEDMMEEFIWNIFGWPKPDMLHYGMLNLEGVKLSKTESRRMMEKKIYKGWDDPRTWTMQSLKKRGILPEAIRNFIINMGMSLSDVNVPVDILYAENRKLIDTKANRYFCVMDPVAISVKGSKTKSTKALLHPDFPKRGSRKISVNVNKIYVERSDFEKFKGAEVGLMNLFSIKLDKVSQMTSEEVKYEIQKIHWVSEPVKIKIVMPNGKEIYALAEPSIKKLKIGSIVQFPRIGFARLDKRLTFYFAHK